MLKGTELLETIASMPEGSTRTEQCRACGYEIDGKLHFTAFFEAILEARGEIHQPETIEAEDSDYQEQIDELLEDYPADAIRAFIELYGEDDLDRFTDSYQGEMSGAEFAEQLVTDCYGMHDLPGFVEVDWEATWENLERHDYSEQDGFIFSECW